MNIHFVDGIPELEEKDNINNVVLTTDEMYHYFPANRSERFAGLEVPLVPVDQTQRQIPAR